MNSIRAIKAGNFLRKPKKKKRDSKEEREARINLYTERADKGLCIFTGKPHIEYKKR